MGGKSSRAYASAPIRPPSGGEAREPVPGAFKALLIGCGYPGEANALQGSLQDVINVKQFLERVRFVPSEGVRVLTDDPAAPSRHLSVHGVPSKRAIIDGLQWLCRGAEPGHSLFMHFAGHSGEVREALENGPPTPDAGGDVEEALIPSGWRGAVAGVVTSRDVLSAIRRLPSGVRLVFLCDCSFGGGSLRLRYGLHADSWGTTERPAPDPQDLGASVSVLCTLRRQGAHVKAASGALTTAFVKTMDSNKGPLTCGALLRHMHDKQIPLISSGVLLSSSVPVADTDLWSIGGEQAGSGGYNTNEVRRMMVRKDENGRVGITYAGVDPVMVTGVASGSPAHVAGVRPGVALLEISGQAVTTATEAEHLFRNAPQFGSFEVITGTEPVAVATPRPRPDVRFAEEADSDGDSSYGSKRPNFHSGNDRGVHGRADMPVGSVVLVSGLPDSGMTSEWGRVVGSVREDVVVEFPNAEGGSKRLPCSALTRLTTSTAERLPILPPSTNAPRQSLPAECTVVKKAGEPLGIQFGLPDLVVNAVDPDGAAAKAGVALFARRRLTHVDGVAVKGPRELFEATSQEERVRLRFAPQDESSDQPVPRRRSQPAKKPRRPGKSRPKAKPQHAPPPPAGRGQFTGWKDLGVPPPQVLGSPPRPEEFATLHRAALRNDAAVFSQPFARLWENPLVSENLGRVREAGDEAGTSLLDRVARLEERLAAAEAALKSGGAADGRKELLDAGRELFSAELRAARSGTGLDRLHLHTDRYLPGKRTGSAVLLSSAVHRATYPQDRKTSPPRPPRRAAVRPAPPPPAVGRGVARPAAARIQVVL